MVYLVILYKVNICNEIVEKIYFKVNLKFENKFRVSIILNCICFFMGKFNNLRIWIKKFDSFYLIVFILMYM